MCRETRPTRASRRPRAPPSPSRWTWTRTANCGNAAGEIIRYEYDAANLRLNRESITCNPGRSADVQSFLGPIAGQPGVRTVEVANGALPVFRYFDGTGAQIAYANLPNDIPRIRRIEIALLVRSADVVRDAHLHARVVRGARRGLARPRQGGAGGAGGGAGRRADGGGGASGAGAAGVVARHRADRGRRGRHRSPPSTCTRAPRR